MRIHSYSESKKFVQIVLGDGRSTNIVQKEGTGTLERRLQYINILSYIES